MPKLLSFQTGISSSFLPKPLATLEMSYLLKSWKLDCVCHSDRSEILVGHLGTVLVHFGIVV
jgi:hypothetical protein